MRYLGKLSVVAMAMAFGSVANAQTEPVKIVAHLTHGYVLRFR